MANLAPRECVERNCPHPARLGYRCEAHSRQQERQRRGSAASRGYDSGWDKRARLFRQRYPLCGMRPNGLRPVMSRCFDERRTTPAQQTDHVIPHRGDQALFWDEDGNWQALCAACGARKTQAGL
jgi:5-methylcytosine-specific restriction protein A